MFCSNCGKIIKEGSKFCKYCGGQQKKALEEATSVISNFSLSDYENSRKGKDEFVNKAKKIIAAVVGIVVVIWCVGNYHQCDWCDTKFVGTAYYDAWDSDTIMCEKCAKSYYAGLDYTRFKVQ